MSLECAVNILHKNYKLRDTRWTDEIPLQLGGSCVHHGLNLNTLNDRKNFGNIRQRRYCVARKESCKGGPVREDDSDLEQFCVDPPTHPSLGSASDYVPSGITSIRTARTTVRLR